MSQASPHHCSSSNEMIPDIFSRRNIEIIPTSRARGDRVERNDATTLESMVNTLCYFLSVNSQLQRSSGKARVGLAHSKSPASTASNICIELIDDTDFNVVKSSVEVEE